MQIGELLAKLKRVRKNGNGWAAQCPAHQDKNPSLRIAEGQDGRILLTCFAGCSAEEIVEVLGLEMSDLFVHRANGAGKRQTVATYDYADETGKLLFQVVRYDPKDFRARRPDGKGGWVWNLGGVPRVLYGLPSLSAAAELLIVEGERDVETARRLGFVATCNPGGAGKWNLEYNECLRSKQVAIIADADPPGVRHARDVAKSIAGVAASAKLIEALPGGGKDLTDFVERGGTAEKLRGLIAEAPVTAANVAGSERGFKLTRLGDLLREPEERTSWLVDEMLPSGGLSLLAGKPKSGKSTLARFLALCVARGERFLERETVRGGVIYLALEEKRQEVRSHFQAMGATGDEEIYIHAAHAPPDALGAVIEEVKARRPALLIIDPLLKFARVKDANDYAQVTQALEPVLILARKHGVHVLVVYHTGKTERSEATDSILGSTAFFAAVDTAVVMKRRQEYRTLQSSQRYGTDLEETVLSFNPESRTFALGGSKVEHDQAVIAGAILDFLKAAGEAKTEPEIDDEVEGKTTLKRKALRMLVEEAKVAREGTGKKGDPYKYSFSCSQDSVGTTEQETENEAPGRINAESILVPENTDGGPGVAESREQESAGELAITATPQTHFEEGEI